MAFKVQKTETSGIVYADPSKPDCTVRVKHNAAAKSLGGNQVTNQVTEVIYNDNNTVTIGTTSVVDPLSVRVRISGSLLSGARKKALLVSLCATLGAWDDEDVMSGFNPTTLPVTIA